MMLKEVDRARYLEFTGGLPADGERTRDLGFGWTAREQCVEGCYVVARVTRRGLSVKYEIMVWE